MSIFVIFGSCASSPGIVTDTFVKLDVLTPIEQLIQRIKANDDVIKHYVHGENGRVIVRADLQDNAGNFDVIYYLDEAKTLGNSVYEVSFIVQEKGTEKILANSLVWMPVPGDEGILLSFDDDYMENWDEFLFLFDEYDAKVTFFIQGVYDPFSIIALNRGHDVGYHSLNHLDLRPLSRDVFLRETITAAESFRQQGVPVSSFAYPFGFSEPWMHEMLFESFSVVRGYGTTFRIYNKNEITFTHIISRAIDNTVIRRDDDFESIINSMLRAVKFLDDGRVLPLTSHEISDAAWAIRPVRLEFVLAAAADLGLKFYRFSDFANLSKID